MSRAALSTNSLHARRQTRRGAPLWLAAALAALTWTSAPAHGQIVIDSFAPDTASLYYKTDSSGDMSTAYIVALKEPNAYVASEVSSSAIGGTRSMELFVNGTPNPTSLALNVGYLAQDATDELNVASNGTSVGVVTLNYSVLAGVDLTGGGANKDIYFQMPGNDTAGLSIAVQLTSGSGSGAETSTASTTIPAFTTMTDAEIPLSGFSTSNGFKMNDVTGIQVVFNQTSQTANADYRVQQIYVSPGVLPVPEPASFATAAIGAVFCGGYLVRRRGRRVAA